MCYLFWYRVSVVQYPDLWSLIWTRQNNLDPDQKQFGSGSEKLKNSYIYSLCIFPTGSLWELTYCTVPRRHQVSNKKSLRKMCLAHESCRSNWFWIIKIKLWTRAWNSLFKGTVSRDLLTFFISYIKHPVGLRAV